MATVRMQEALLRTAPTVVVHTKARLPRPPEERVHGADSRDIDAPF